MSNYFLSLALIIVSLLPNTEQAVFLKNKIEKKILPISKTEEKKEVTRPNLKLASIPDKNPSPEEISSGSRAAYFVDFNSGEVLFSKNEKRKLPMASTTKLMTALIVQEYLMDDQVITVPSYTLRPLDSVMGIPVGTKIKTEELLHGLLIESGSDAAQAFAKTIAKTEPNFVAIMNERAKIMGLENTQFTNSVGYDDNGHYSTAEDLIKLSRIALSNKKIAEIVAKRSYVATAENGQKFYLSNTNKNLDGANYQGVKTGTTFAAGECVITLYSDGKRKILGVVLTSPDRFGETVSIINWSKRNFTWSVPKE